MKTQAHKAPKHLALAGLLLAVFVAILVVPGVNAQTDYVVQSEPNPLVDGTSRIGSTSDSLSDAQTQEYTYEDISEDNITATSSATTKSPSLALTGTWTNPTRAFSSDGLYATTAIDVGTQQYGGYGFSIPSNATIIMVEVGYEAYTSGNEKIGITCSWDGGSSWASEYTSGILPISDPNTVTWVDFTSAVTWTVDMLSDGNFQTRAKGVKTGVMSTVYLDWIPARVTYLVPGDYRLNWEHRVTGVGSHDNYYVRIYGYADAGETFSVKVWNGSTWMDNGYNLPSGAGAWVDYQILNNWVIGGAVSIKYDDDTDGDATAQSIHIDYCSVRGITAAPTFDFSASASPSTVTVQPSSENTTTITITLLSGSTQNVSLSGSWIGGSPSGISTNFNPSSGNPTYSSTLTFTATASASEGNFTYRVSGTGGGLTRTTDIILVIGTPPFNFSLSASPASLTIYQGDTATSTISVSLVSGSPQTVTLSGSWVGGAPSGVSASFNPLSGSPSYTSILTFTSTLSATEGTFTYRVTAQGGAVTRTTDITLTINKVTFSFLLSASPDSVTLMRGDNATSTVSLSLVVGAAEAVSLSGSWSGTAPTGVSAVFNPSSGSPPFSSTLTFTTTSTASAGNYTYQVSGTGGGVTKTDEITVIINTQLTLTITTDKDNYEMGQTIQVSGTAKNAKGSNVSSGTATVTYSSGGWSQQSTAGISNGAFSDNYTISYANPVGTWTVTVSAQDGQGNAGSISDDIGVAIPPGTAYSTVEFLSPLPGVAYPRGERVLIAVRVTDGGAAVEGAGVTFTAPDGKKIALSETAPGTYSTQYTIELDDPIGGWSVSVESHQTVENVSMSGGDYLNIKVEPAPLGVSLISPVQSTLKEGETVQVKVGVSYPNGEPVEDANVIALTPGGENINLAAEGSGIYSAVYTVKSEDIGNWPLQVSVTDSSGNLGSKSSTVSIVPLEIVEVAIFRYWWAILAVAISICVASAFVVQRTRVTARLDRIRRERVELEKLEKQAIIDYFKDGSITREVFDDLVEKYEERRSDLSMEEEVMETKARKRAEKSRKMGIGPHPFKPIRFLKTSKKAEKRRPKSVAKEKILEEEASKKTEKRKKTVIGPPPFKPASFLKARKAEKRRSELSVEKKISEAKAKKKAEKRKRTFIGHPPFKTVRFLKAVKKTEKGKKKKKRK